MNSDIIGLTFEAEIVSVLGVTEINIIGLFIYLQVNKYVNNCMEVVKFENF